MRMEMASQQKEGSGFLKVRCFSLLISFSNLYFLFKGKKARMKASLVKQRTRKEIRSGLSFPVTRIRNALRKSRCCKSIGLGAAIYTTAVLEYLTAELTELSGNCSKENKRKRIIPRDILLAIR